jgi:hypothetical protein
MARALVRVSKKARRFQRPNFGATFLSFAGRRLLGCVLQLSLPFQKVRPERLARSSSSSLLDLSALLLCPDRLSTEQDTDELCRFGSTIDPGVVGSTLDNNVKWLQMDLALVQQEVHFGPN